MSEQFIWNEAEVAFLLRSPEGAVGRDLLRRGVQVESEAKRRASQPPHGYFNGSYYPSNPGAGPGVRTGRLRASITARLESDELGVYAKVGSNVRYAVYLELGTRYNPPGYPFLRVSLKAAEI